MLFYKTPQNTFKCVVLERFEGLDYARQCINTTELIHLSFLTVKKRSKFSTMSFPGYSSSSSHSEVPATTVKGTVFD